MQNHNQDLTADIAAPDRSVNLPKSWMWIRLNQVAEQISRYPTFYGMARFTNGVPVIRGEHINADGTISHDWKNYWFVSEQISGNYPRTIVEPQDLIMSVRGTVGKIGLVDEKLAHAQISPNCLRISLVPHLCSPKFLVFYLQSSYGQSTIQQMTSSTTIRTIKAGAFHELAIPLAPFPEQQRIVAKIEELFTRLNAAVESLQKAKTKLIRYRHSLLEMAMSGELTKEWRTNHLDAEPAQTFFRQMQRAVNKNSAPHLPNSSDRPELPERWMWATLSSLSWGSGYGTSVRCDTSQNGYPILRIPNILRGKINFAGLKFAPQSLSIEDSQLLKSGDLLIVRTNGSKDLIGRAAIIRTDFEDELFFASYLIRYRLLKNGVLWRWLGCIWDSQFIRGHITDMAATSAGQYNISLKKLDGLPIPLPPFEELQIIVNRIESQISAADEIEKTVDQSLARVGRIYQSILKQAFEGKLVPQDQADEPVDMTLRRMKVANAKQQTKKKLKTRKTNAASKQTAEEFDVVQTDLNRYVG
jgi:type I restriction enzyme S subunit